MSAGAVLAAVSGQQRLEAPGGPMFPTQAQFIRTFQNFRHIQASISQTNVSEYLICVVSVMKPSVLFVQLFSLIIDQK